MFLYKMEHRRRGRGQPGSLEVAVLAGGFAACFNLLLRALTSEEWVEMAGAGRVYGALGQRLGKFMKMKGQVADINSQ